MDILLNGENHDLPNDCKLDQLIDQLDLGGKRLAIELNREIVPRSQFEQTTLADGDVVEIVHAIGGG